MVCYSTKFWVCVKICCITKSDCVWLYGKRAVDCEACLCHFQSRPIFVFNSLLLTVRLLHVRAFQWLRAAHIDGALSLLTPASVCAHRQAYTIARYCIAFPDDTQKLSILCLFSTPTWTVRSWGNASEVAPVKGLYLSGCSFDELEQCIPGAINSDIST